MKKIICTTLIFALVFIITACGSREEKQNFIKPEMSTSTAASLDSETEKDETEASRKSTEQGVTEMKMKVRVGDTTFTATLAENSSVDALKKLMANEPLTLNMSDYGNMEKSVDLGVTLPQNNKHMNTKAGDIILYQGRTLAIYYDTNSWSLTPIAKIDNVDEEKLKDTLGNGDVTVILSLK